MSSSLPDRPHFDWLRKTAKDRLRQLRAAGQRVRLAEAQLAVAREHGFSSWRQLKAHVEALAASAVLLEPATPPTLLDEAQVQDFLKQVGRGQLDAVRALLAETPALVQAIGPHPFWGGRPQALHVAIETNRRDMFDLLLARGADVNGTNDQYDHWSPLMLAIQRERGELRDVLIARGARIGLLEALMLADDERVEALLRSDGLPAITPNGGSILAFARTPFAIDRLLALGAPADPRDRWGSTPIDIMSRLGARGHALVEHMVRHGIAADAKDYARLGDQARLADLVAADPTIAHRDAVMMAAVDFGHPALVSWLLERGANVNARADWGSRHTALHSAAWNGDLEMVQLLLAAGANRAARDEEHHNTPEGWARVALDVTNNPTCAEVAAFLLEPARS